MISTYPAKSGINTSTYRLRPRRRITVNRGVLICHAAAAVRKYLVTFTLIRPRVLWRYVFATRSRTRIYNPLARARDANWLTAAARPRRVHGDARGERMGSASTRPRGCVVTGTSYAIYAPPTAATAVNPLTFTENSTKKTLQGWREKKKQTMYLASQRLIPACLSIFIGCANSIGTRLSRIGFCLRV